MVFINADPDNPSQSDTDRDTVRRVSRRAGAATRRTQRGELSRANTLQIPNFLIRQADHLVPLNPPLQYGPHDGQVAQRLSIFIQPDLADNILRHVAASESSSDPRRWLKVYRLAHDAILRSLPQLYGHSKCLDDAIDCIATLAHHSIFASTRTESGELQVAHSYGRAIRSLSDIITSGPVDWTAWCATLLMALFEVRVAFQGDLHF